MSVALIICLIALLFAVLSIPFPSYPLLAVAVILLAIVGVISARGG